MLVRNLNLCYKAAVMVVLVIWFTGCQQMGGLLGNRWNPQATSLSDHSLDENDSTAILTAQQKADIQIAMARSLEQQGKTDQAIKVYYKALRKDNHRADVYHRLAILHDKQGKCDKSAALYQEVLNRDPDNVEVYCDLGYSYYLQKRWQDAEENLRKAIALRPDLARAHNNLGLLLARSGRYEEAMVEFSQAGCEEYEARVNLAFALMWEQQWAEAKKQFEVALTIVPSSKAAQEGLENLQSLLARGHLTQNNHRRNHRG